MPSKSTVTRSAIVVGLGTSAVLQPSFSDLFSRKALVVVAHPDDEVLGCGGVLPRLDLLAVVHATDGAPRDGADARRAGFDGPRSYAAARRKEAENALALAGVGADRLVGLGLPDQEAAADLAALARRLSPLVSGAGVVLTHGFEGGHPDHDAVAFAVHAAARLVARDGAAPALLEMPFYHAGPDGWIRQRFSPHAAIGAETVVALSEDDRGRKAAMIAAHRTQRDTLADFDLWVERFRLAPDYDFETPPDELLYERHAWNMTRARWIEAVRRARAALAQIPADAAR